MIIFWFYAMYTSCIDTYPAHVTGNNSEVCIALAAHRHARHLAQSFKHVRDGSLKYFSTTWHSNTRGVCVMFAGD